ncbi:MAG TPA: hypothetical protein VGP93_07765, partial [Polyangiaceae bacterium]|nr:hypothetical protein [Polyangiaceae bacterium]
MLKFKAFCFAAVFAAAAPMLVTGCVDNQSKQPVESTGTLSAALSTIGSDGATYSFPAGTYLYVLTSSWIQYYPIDGTATLFGQQLPVGSYTLGFYVSGGGPLMLDRTDSSGTTSVSADW